MLIRKEQEIIIQITKEKNLIKITDLETINSQGIKITRTKKTNIFCYLV